MRAPEHFLPATPRSLARQRLGLPWFLLVTVLWLSAEPAHAAKVTARTGEITLPTYGWAAVRHPYFRGTDGKNIYPYPMLDFLSRDKTNRTYQTVVLENEYLRITFLPELGGKIHEALDKTTGRPMFYVNHVVKPGLIGQCGAWTSGGVEWNTGPQGHTVSCMQPVDVVILPPEPDGSRSVAIGETERIYRTKWTVVVTLRPGRAFIEERVRIYNPTETVRPYYFWNCTAVPNTPGFRFIYPMTLGCDHAGEKFFNWPIDHGKDLTRGTNYQDASSIFAWQCDQDFFGSYNDDLDRGVVSCANHHQLPGKKAWTWGQGGFGKMHQMDLTDSDGPYNEVQTGPLLTQAQVGRLDPCEAVEWKEWWYPVHGIGGFTYANKNLAANAAVENGVVRVRLIGTAVWRRADVVVTQSEYVTRQTCDLEPGRPAEVRLKVEEPASPFDIRVYSKDVELLAAWPFPSELPVRKPPGKPQPPKTASQFVQSGWQEFLFARCPAAAAQFRKALEKDENCRDARVGLAHLELDRDPGKAVEEARAAVAVDPDCGPGHYALAVAESRLGNPETALEEAWQAALDPATAVAARALIGKLLIQQRHYGAAIAALAAPGPWREDALSQNRLAFAWRQVAKRNMADALARASLETDPLDLFAQSLLWLDRPETRSGNRPGSLRGNVPGLLELVAEYSALGDPETPRPLLSGQNISASWPYQLEMLDALTAAVEEDPKDGRATLLLGHLLFHLGRHTEGRAMWKRAAELGAEPVIACRALGMAAKTLDNDLKTAREWLEKASQADPKDSIVARDLADVLFALADKEDSDEQKRALVTEARNRLEGAFAEGKGRSDFVALLARAQIRLEDFAATMRLLDSVRVTVWEGGHEVHDLFVQSHLALGEAQLKTGQAAEALAEFNRALDYPANLATGKLEGAREAHIHYARGNALAALGRTREAVAAWKLAADEPESKDAKIEAARQRAKEALEKSGRGTP